MAGSDKLDAGLQKIINQALNGILDTDREDNAPVTSEDMEELTSLVIDSGDDVEDLDGLRYAVNLTSLSVYGDIAGLEEIGYLEKLESLFVNQNSGLETLSVFGDKPALEVLDCSDNRKGYQETIRSLTGLRTLYMPYCEVTDEDTGMFSALADLETLVLNMNNINQYAVLR